MPSEEILSKYMRPAEPMSDLAIVLLDVKYPHNLGQTFRMAADFAVPQVWVSGRRIRDAVTELDRIPREERIRGYQDVHLIWDEDPLAHAPEGVTPVAVEFRPDAVSLFDYQHPARAVYVFGPEDGSIAGRALAKCHHHVVIDTMHCLNLSSAVGIVLYDRDCKAHQARRHNR